MNRKQLMLMTGFILFLAALSGCRGSKNKTSAVKATSIPSPEAEKATVTGKVFSTSANKAYPKAAVWLAEVYRQGGNGVYVLDHAFSPGVYADGQGVFVIPNVDPKDYVIVIGDPEGLYEVIPDDTGKARVWNLAGGQVLDVGQLSVSLAPPTPVP